MTVRLLFLILALIFTATPEVSASEHSPASAGVEHTPDQHLNLKIQVRDGLVSMDVEGIEIGHVLMALSVQAKIPISIHEGVKGKIRITMTDVPVEEAIRRLCEGTALVFESLPEEKSYRIIQAGAYARSRTESEEGRELGPGLDSWRGVAESADGASTLPSGQGGRGSRERLYDSNGRLLYKPRELLVRFKAGLSPERMDGLHGAMGNTVMDKMDRIRLQRLKLAEGLTEAEAIQRYIASGKVELVERHALRYPNKIPNDPLFNEQWNLPKIGAPRAWDFTTGSPEVIIAVIDSGVDYLHPDLADNAWFNPAEAFGDANGDGFPGIKGVDDDGDGLIDEDSQGRQPGETGYTNDLKDDDDENGYADDIYGWDFAGTVADNVSLDEDSDPMDVTGHGTHVAGIIAAEGNNGVGIAGVSWKAKIMVLKVQADNNDTYFEDWAILKAIYYAIDHGARIVNCSFGGEDNPPPQPEYEAFVALQNAGILAVCAAGNETRNTDLTPNYPSSYDLPNIISVAASDQSDQLANFSNYGRTTVDVMAPGASIKSTLPAGAYTEASVAVESVSGTTTYPAIGMAYAGLTAEQGITATLHDCGKGYTDEFPSGVSGYIALIERGKRDEVDFYFHEKATNARNAEALAAIIYNNLASYEDDGFDQYGGTLGSPGEWIPVVSVTKADGEALTGMENPPVTLVNKPTNNPLSYGLRQGTSMAAPHVSGIAGLVLSKNPDLDYAGVKSAILDSVDKIQSVADKMVSGGRVNALAAVCSLNTLPGDLSFDNNLSLEDAILALQIVAGLSPAICPAGLASGVDINEDGKVGIEEAVFLLQKISDLGR